MKLEIPFVNTYFDFEDYSDPVKTHIDARLSFDVLSKFIKTNYVYIQVIYHLYNFRKMKLSYKMDFSLTNQEDRTKSLYQWIE